MSKESYKKAIVLTGGSIKGAFQAGALAEVLKTFQPDVIYGVSIGALNGIFIVDRNGRDLAKPLEKVGEELISFWETHIRSFKDVGRKRGILELACQILRNNFQGLLDMTKYQNLVRKTFDIQSIAQSNIDYGCGYVNLNSGEYAQNHKLGKELENKSQFIDYVIASGITPIIYPTAYINNMPLVDGGTRHVAPFSDLNEYYPNIEEIVCISCHPPKLNPEPQNFDPKKVGDLASRTMEIAVNEIVNSDIKTRELINIIINIFEEELKIELPESFPYRKKVSMWVIEPEKELEINLEHFCTKDIIRLINQGRERAKEIMSQAPTI
jgi:NTE family protein